MRDWAALKLALVLITICGTAAGCRSLTSPPRPADGGLVADRFAVEGFDWVRPAPLPEAAFAPAVADAQAPLFALYATGIHYELEEAYPQASDFYTRAANLDPASDILLRRRAYTLTEQGDLAGAARIMEEHYAAFPDSETALAWLIDFYLSTDEKTRVLQLAQRAVQLYPKEPTSWIRLAIVKERTGADFEDIAKTIRDGIAKSTNNVPLRRLFAHLCQPRILPADADPKLRQEALKNYQALRKDEPADPQIAIMNAAALLAAGRVPDAATILFETEKQNPDKLELKLHFAAVFMENRTAEEAAALLAETIAANPRKSQNLFGYLALFLRETGDAAAAKENFTFAVTAHPDDVSSWIHLAALNEYPAALLLLQAAAEANPKSIRLVEAIAYLHFEAARHAEADFPFQQVARAMMEGYSPMPGFLLTHALNSTHLNRPDEAAHLLFQATEANPEQIMQYVIRIAGAADAAIVQYATSTLDALLAMPIASQDTLLAGKALLFSMIGDYDAAIAAFAQAEQIAGENPKNNTIASYDNFHFWYAVALDAAGRRDETVERLKRVIAINANHADALNHLAYIWALAGESLPTALRYSQRALSLDPENGAYIDTLGWIYFQMGRYADAVRELETAAAMRPAEEEILDHLRQAREKLQTAPPADLPIIGK